MRFVWRENCFFSSLYVLSKFTFLSSYFTFSSFFFYFTTQQLLTFVSLSLSFYSLLFWLLNLGLLLTLMLALTTFSTYITTFFDGLTCTMHLYITVHMLCVCANGWCWNEQQQHFLRWLIHFQRKIERGLCLSRWLLWHNALWYSTAKSAQKEQVQCLVGNQPADFK